jgi:hypothetical protein
MFRADLRPFVPTRRKRREVSRKGAKTQRNENEVHLGGAGCRLDAANGRNLCVFAALRDDFVGQKCGSRRRPELKQSLTADDADARG